MRVPSQRSGTKQIIVRWNDQRRIVQRARPAVCNLGVLIVASQQIDSRDIVSGNDSLNLIKNCNWIKWCQPGLEVMRFEPDGMTVGLTGLRSASLSHVGARSAAERHKVRQMESHGIRNADDHFKIGLCPAYITSLFRELNIAAGIGYRAFFLVGIGSGQNNIGYAGGFGEEHFLNDHKGLR